LYFRNLTKNKSIFEIKDVIHFFLPILLTIEYNSHLFSAQFQIDLLYVFRALLSLNIIYYYTQILIILSKRFWKKKSPVEIQTEQESLMKKWTIILFVAFQTSATKMIWSEIVFGHTDLLSDGFLTWIVWFVVFMMILTSPSILNVYLSQISREPKVTSKKMSHWRLQPIQKITNKQDLLLSQKINTALDAYFQQIDQFIEKEQFFRQSGISINDLAMKLKIPKSHLSFIFKYHSSLSFSDMKKLLRIQQATALIDQGYLKTNTFDSLSKEVGFSTYNSFYIAFKEVTTKAPQEYTSGLG
jgi:AraC-like DNA-binding protein